MITKKEVTAKNIREYINQERARFEFGYVDASGLDLRGADLSNMYLKIVNFASSDLRGANFENTTTTQCSFANANLRDIKTAGLTIENVACSDVRWTQYDLPDFLPAKEISYGFASEMQSVHGLMAHIINNEVCTIKGKDGNLPFEKIDYTEEPTIYAGGKKVAEFLPFRKNKTKQMIHFCLEHEIVNSWIAKNGWKGLEIINSDGELCRSLVAENGVVREMTDVEIRIKNYRFCSDNEAVLRHARLV